MKSIFKSFLLVAALIIVFSSCDRTSSPEGRMGIKLEDLQQQMLDSMQRHHNAMMDSIGQLRKEISALKASR